MFDSIKFSWPSALGTSISRYGYTATLLPNSNIVYIGGQSTPDINQVYNFKYYSFHNFVIYEIIDFKNHSRFQSLTQKMEAGLQWQVLFKQI